MTMVAVESVTLDGVMQAPGRPDEDSAAASRTAAGRALQRRGDGPGDGRGNGRGPARCCSAGGRTRTSTASGRSQPPNPFTDVLDATQKYVASTTLDEPLPGRTRPCSRATPCGRAPTQASDGRGLASSAAASSCGRSRGADWSTSTCCSSTRSCWAPGGDCSRRRDGVAAPRRERHDHDGRDHRDLRRPSEGGADEAVPAQRQPARRRPAAARGPRADHARRRRAQRRDARRPARGCSPAACTRRAPRPSCGHATARCS